MISNIKSFKKSILTLLGILLFFTTKSFGIELNMYYPVAVGGPLTKIVDGMVDAFTNIESSKEPNKKSNNEDRKSVV